MQVPQLTVTFADGAVAANSNQALSGELLTKFSALIPAESNNKNVAVGADVSQILAVLLLATVAMTVATRSSGGADVDVLALAAGQPVLWQAGGPIPLSALFTADFVSLQVDAATEGTLTIWILSDATP